MSKVKAIDIVSAVIQHSREHGYRPESIELSNKDYTELNDYLASHKTPDGYAQDMRFCRPGVDREHLLVKNVIVFNGEW